MQSGSSSTNQKQERENVLHFLVGLVANFCRAWIKAKHKQKYSDQQAHKMSVEGHMSWNTNFGLGNRLIFAFHSGLLLQTGVCF